MVSRWISPHQVAGLLGATAWASPAYRDLAERLRLLIVDGRIGHLTRLPSERDLATALSLSRSTIAAAYADLRDRGYAKSRRGAGNFAVAARTEATSMLGSNPPAADGLIELTRAAPQATPGLVRTYQRTIERLPNLLAATGYDPYGLPELRIAVAERYRARGLPTEPDQIVITSGALSAIAVVAHGLLARGDRVLVEAPTYPNAIHALRELGNRLVGYPLGDDGWDPDAIEHLVRQTSPRAAYLVPDFHNPTGQLMSTEHRATLRDIFRRHRVTMIIDETMVDLPLDPPEGGRPVQLPPPLADGAADSITIGSASKVFWGGLRVGWIRAPRSLIRPLVQSRIAIDLGTAPLEQLVTTELLADPATVAALQRERLTAQCDQLIAALADRLPSWDVTRPAGGQSLWARLPAEVSARMAANAERFGLVISPGHQFYPDGGGERRIRLPYTLPPEVLTEAVDRLAALWSEVASMGEGSTGLSLTA